MNPLALLPALLPAAAGATIAALAFSGWNALIDNPHLVALERARAQAAVEIAASAAKAAEQLRQFRIGEAAFGWADQQEQSARAEHDARVAILMTESVAHAQIDNGTCRITQSVVDRFNGVQHDK